MAQTTFNFDERTEQLIEELKEEFGATSKAEVVRKALALLEFARMARQRGEDIAAVDKNREVKSILVT